MLKFLKYFNFKYFLISFAVGILYIYLTNDYKKVVVLYPNPTNIDKYTYVDKTNNCFNYELNKRDCPKSDKEYVNINVKY